MKANEFRTGNLFRFKSTGRIKVVTDIVTFDKRQANINRVDIRDVEGIELSEEILLKAGFEKGDNIHCHPNFLFFTFRKSCRMLTICIKSKLVCLHDLYNGLKDQNIIQIPIEIEFIHQLQNLYFALTGEELEELEKLKIV